MRVLRRIAINLTLSSICLAITSCDQKPSSQADKTVAASGTDDIVPLKFATWDGKGSESIKPSITETKNFADLQMALSVCDCAQAFTARILTQNAISRGVLPQVLVPKIRQKIATDSKLAFINKLPPGLSNLATSMFANEDKIYSTVRDGIQDSLNHSLAYFGGSTLSQRLPFRLDLFTSSVFAPNGYPLAFDIYQQAARWNLVMGSNAMWTLSRPLDGYDHGLQLLETMRVAAEWAYLSGIGSSGEPDGFGGLAASVADGPAKFAKPANPEKAPDNWAIFNTGRYTIRYPAASSVDLATRIREEWTSNPGGASLEEQAMVWRAAALGFAKMRPDRLGRAAPIFNTPDGALSMNAAKLPLVWLPGLAALLEQRYVDRSTQTISEYAFATDGKNQKASVASLLTAAQAIEEWRGATADLAQSGLSEGLKKQLGSVPDRLELPLQFITRSILNEYTTIHEDGFGAWVTANKDDGSTQNDPSIVAKMVATLGWLEMTALPAPELKSRVVSLYHWHVKQNLLPLATNGQPLEANALIWNLRAAEIMSSYKDAAPWVLKLRDNLRAIVANWR